MCCPISCSLCVSKPSVVRKWLMSLFSFMCVVSLSGLLVIVLVVVLANPPEKQPKYSPALLLGSSLHCRSAPPILSTWKQLGVRALSRVQFFLCSEHPWRQPRPDRQRIP